MEPIEEIEIYFKIAAVIIGAFWVVSNYLIKRERYPKMGFNLDVKYLGEENENNILEFISILDNKGLVRQYIDVKSFILKIRYLTDKDKFDNNTTLPGSNKQDISEQKNKESHSEEKSKANFFCLSFPHSIKPDFDEGKIYWMPERWKYVFVDSGINQKISKTLVLPKEAKYVQVTSEFKYWNDKKSGLHTTQNVYNIYELKK